MLSACGSARYPPASRRIAAHYTCRYQSAGITPGLGSSNDVSLLVTRTRSRSWSDATGRIRRNAMLVRLTIRHSPDHVCMLSVARSPFLICQAAVQMTLPHPASASQSGHPYNSHFAVAAPRPISSWLPAHLVLGLVSFDSADAPAS